MFRAPGSPLGLNDRRMENGMRKRMTARALVVAAMVAGVSAFGLVNNTEPVPAVADEPVVVTAPDGTVTVNQLQPDGTVKGSVTTPDGETFTFPDAVIQEDDPRWDCRWDGNETCGVLIQGMTYLIQFEDGSPVGVHVSPDN